jgi:ferredoxin-thioredoxin reductase catalytic chain
MDYDLKELSKEIISGKYTEEQVEKMLQNVAKSSYIDALREYAWWKDGEQFVGCGVKTLKQAIEEYVNDLEGHSFILVDEELLKLIDIGITEHLHFCDKCEINPDVDIVNNIKNGLVKKFRKFGNFYCPCKLQNTPENICPCKDHVKEIEANGICHCRLYIKNKGEEK